MNGIVRNTSRVENSSHETEQSPYTYLNAGGEKMTQTAVRSRNNQIQEQH